jgi:hypothetical protein
MHPLTRWDWRQRVAWALTDIDALKNEFAHYVRLIESYHA